MDRKPKIMDAVLELVGGQMSGETENFSSIQYESGQTPPTEAEANTKLKSMVSDWEALDYSRKREAEYPSIQECVHAILDDDLDALQAKRADIKTKYPKG